VRCSLEVCFWQSFQPRVTDTRIRKSVAISYQSLTSADNFSGSLLYRNTCAFAPESFSSQPHFIHISDFFIQRSQLDSFSCFRIERHTCEANRKTKSWDFFCFQILHYLIRPFGPKGFHTYTSQLDYIHLSFTALHLSAHKSSFFWNSSRRPLQSLPYVIFRFVYPFTMVLCSFAIGAQGLTV
jgi:hypothetical protein